MKLPLLNNDTNEIQFVDTTEIIFFVRNHPGVIIHTYDAKFRPITTLKDFFGLLSSEGFDYVEKSTVANLDKITRYDPHTRIAFYDKEGYPTKGCVISRRNAKKVK